MSFTNQKVKKPDLIKEIEATDEKIALLAYGKVLSLFVGPALRELVERKKELVAAANRIWGSGYKGDNKAHA